jgi:hypothetical protein
MSMLGGRPGDLDAAGLTAPTDLDLRLDDGDAADLLRDRLGVLRRSRHLTEADRHAVLREQLLGLGQPRSAGAAAIRG